MKIRKLPHYVEANRKDYHVGIREIRDGVKSAFVHFPYGVISWDTCKRRLEDGTLPSEERLDEETPYIMHVNSCPPFAPIVDRVGEPDIADGWGKSLAQTQRDIYSGKVPVDYFGGTVFSTQTSLDAWKKK